MEQAAVATGTPVRRRAPHAVMDARIRAVSAVVDLAKTESGLDEMDPPLQNPPPSAALPAAEEAWKKTPAFKKIKAELRGILEKMDATVSPSVRAIITNATIESLGSEAEGWGDLEELASLRGRLRRLEAGRIEMVKMVERIREIDDDLQNENLSTTLRLQEEWAKSALALVETCREKAIACLKADIEAQASEVAEVAREWSNTDADGWDGSEAHAG